MKVSVNHWCMPMMLGMSQSHILKFWSPVRPCDSGRLAIKFLELEVRDMYVRKFINREFFLWLNISSVNVLPGFIFVAVTSQQYKLTQFIHRRKYFGGLIFFLEFDGLKFFFTKISLSAAKSGADEGHWAETSAIYIDHHLRQFYIKENYCGNCSPPLYN